MMEDCYVYCISRTHRYAGEKEITMEMLKDEALILFNTDSVQTQTVVAACAPPESHLRCACIAASSPQITNKFGIIWKKGIFVPDQLTKFINFVKEYDVTPYLPTL